MTELPKCAIAGCDNTSDPLWTIHSLGDIPRCDGHEEVVLVDAAHLRTLKTLAWRTENQKEEVASDIEDVLNGLIDIGLELGGFGLHWVAINAATGHIRKSQADLAKAHQLLSEGTAHLLSAVSDIDAKAAEIATFRERAEKAEAELYSVRVAHSMYVSTLVREADLVAMQEERDSALQQLDCLRLSPETVARIRGWAPDVWMPADDSAMVDLDRAYPPDEKT